MICSGSCSIFMLNIFLIRDLRLIRRVNFWPTDAGKALFLHMERAENSPEDIQETLEASTSTTSQRKFMMRKKNRSESYPDLNLFLFVLVYGPGMSIMVDLLRLWELVYVGTDLIMGAAIYLWNLYSASSR